jgi:hypothetical protein
MGRDPAVSARRQVSDVRQGSDVRKLSCLWGPVEAWRSGAGDVGRPLGFGRPRCRTSEVHRTSEEFANSLSWGFRTSVVCRTSDTSDVRSRSDVRRPMQSFCPRLPPSCPSMSDVRTGSDVRCLESCLPSLGLPLPR